MGLAGLIGAGRSEVAQSIFGLRRLHRGHVSVRGRPLRIGNPKHALNEGIVYIPEERRAQGLFLPLSIERNISLVALGRMSSRGFVLRSRERQIVKGLIDQLQIHGQGPNAPVIRLSGGNQQKVVLAKGLAMDPSILLLDEPTRGVDVGARAEIYELIDGFARDGKAILLISSDLEEVLSMSDRVLVMAEGHLTGAFDHGDATPQRVGAAAAGVTAGADGQPERTT